jgi:hypothetical protein
MPAAWLVRLKYHKRTADEFTERVKRLLASFLTFLVVQDDFELEIVHQMHPAGRIDHTGAMGGLRAGQESRENQFCKVEWTCNIAASAELPVFKVGDL